MRSQPSQLICDEAVKLFALLGNIKTFSEARDVVLKSLTNQTSELLMLMHDEKPNNHITRGINFTPLCQKASQTIIIGSLAVLHARLAPQFIHEVAHNSNNGRLV